MAEGLKIEDATKLTRADLVKAIGGLSTRKQHAAALAIETLQQALRNYV